MFLSFSLSFPVGRPCAHLSLIFRLTQPAVSYSDPAGSNKLRLQPLKQNSRRLCASSRPFVSMSPPEHSLFVIKSCSILGVLSLDRMRLIRSAGLWEECHNSTHGGATLDDSGLADAEG